MTPHWLGFTDEPGLASAGAVAIPMVTTKAALLAAVAKGLQFPWYFGSNWDALEECIRDLAWLPAIPLTLVHESVRELDEKDLATYLSIAENAAEERARDGRSSINFIFSERDRPTVVQAVNAMPPRVTLRDAE